MTDGVPYDAEIEYLESTGTQYVDTGVVPTDDHTIYCLFNMAISGNSKQACVFGCDATSGSNSLYIVIAGDGHFVHKIGSTSGTNWPSSNAFANNPFEVSFSNKKVITVMPSNPTYTRTISGSALSVDRSLLLFRRHEQAYNGGRILACSISLSGTLVRDYIPVRVGTTGYLFDRVTRRLYGNSGTGSFVLGPDVARPVLPARVVSVKPYDAEIEYLKGNNTSDVVGPWINTGIVPIAAENFGVEADAQWTEGDINIYGVASGGYYLLNKTNTNKQFRVHLGSGNAVYINVESPKSRHKYKVYGANIYVDGTLVKQSKFSGNIGTKSIAIFGRRGDNTSGVNGMSKCKIYGFKIWVSGALARDYIPVRVGTSGYLYDRVSGQLFGNAGTGSFVLGPDVRVERPLAGLVPVARNVRILPYDAEVDYVEFTGTQYIRTGVNINSGIVFFVDLQLTSTKDQQRIFSTSRNSPNAILYTSGGKYKYSWGSVQWKGTGVSINTNRFVIEVDAINDAITFGNNRISLNGGPLPQSSSTIIDIGIANMADAALRPHLKFYACRIFYFDLLVRDFIPVRVGSIGYLYDRVTRRLYGSATSTPLIAGPDK